MDNGKPAPALGIFLLFFLLTPISPEPDCKKLTAVECKGAHLLLNYYNVASFGFDVVGLGFDITTMKNAQGTVLDMNSWEDTDGSCTVCKNSLLKGPPVQFLPLAISEWNTTKADCIYDIYNKPPSSIADLFLKQASYVGNLWNKNISLPYTSNTERSYYIGSLSEIIKVARERSSDDRSGFFPYEIKCKKYRVRTRENPPISEAFKERVKRLPEFYSDGGPELYIDLIRTYGTHYIVEAELGGVLRSVVAFKYCKMFLAGFNMNDIRHCLTKQMNSIHAFDTTTDHFCQRLDNLLENCTTVAWGGNRNMDLCRKGDNVQNYNRWRAELPIFPGLVTYKIEPIHFLLDDQDKRHDLAQAVHNYIHDRHVWFQCSNSCPSRYRPKLDEVCACKCFKDDLANDDCCPKQIGISRVTVWIDNAVGLRGDWYNEADTVVEVELFGVIKRTSELWNTNSPRFGRKFDFGAVPLVHGANKVYIRVIELNVWSNVITDSFAVPIGAGQIQDKFQVLTHGILYFRYQVVCGANQVGHNCREYTPQKATYYNNFKHF